MNVCMSSHTKESSHHQKVLCGKLNDRRVPNSAYVVLAHWRLVGIEGDENLGWLGLTMGTRTSKGVLDARGWREICTWIVLV